MSWIIHLKIVQESKANRATPEPPVKLRVTVQHENVYLQMFFPARGLLIVLSQTLRATVITGKAHQEPDTPEEVQSALQIRERILQ